MWLRGFFVKMALPNNTGSFGAAIGDVSALKNAMERRGMDASVLDQVSSAAPGPQTPIAPDVPTGSGLPTAQPLTSVPGSSGGQTQAQFRSAEMEMALKALKGVVDTEAKIAETLVGAR